MDIKEIALRLLAEEFPGMHQENQAFMVEFAEALIESYKEGLLKEVGERIVALEIYEHLAAEYGLSVFEDMAKLKDQLAAAQEEIARLSALCDKWNTECDEYREENTRMCNELAKAEQRVAEACALQVATETRFHWLDAARVAKEIRSGEWRKFVKEAVSTQKEYYESVFQDGAKRISTLTRQRDNLLAQVNLAVTALESIAGRRMFIDNLASNVDIAVMTLDAIKESEEN